MVVYLLLVFAPPEMSPLPLPLTLAPVRRFSPLLSIPPVLSTLPPLVCCHPSSPSHRYLTPRHKAEFCDVTKWVEDVNRNTRGPFIRYYLRLHPSPPTLVSPLVIHLRDRLGFFSFLLLSHLHVLCCSVDECVRRPQRPRLRLCYVTVQAEPLGRRHQPRRPVRAHPRSIDDGTKIQP